MAENLSPIYVDLNVRLPVVNTDAINITNSKAVLQSITRLFATQEGEIPYYRSYGLNLKQFLQRPLTQVTAQEIYNYVRRKIEMYEKRVDVVGANTNADFNNSVIYMSFTLRVKTTGEIIVTDILDVPLR